MLMDNHADNDNVEKDMYNHDNDFSMFIISDNLTL